MNISEIKKRQLGNITKISIKNTIIHVLDANMSVVSVKMTLCIRQYFNEILVYYYE
jgi:hypothetical protein